MKHRRKERRFIMAVFPDTPKTLIKKIAEFANGNDNAKGCFRSFLSVLVRHHLIDLSAAD